MTSTRVDDQRGGPEVRAAGAPRLTTNLFHGQGERDDRLEVVDGHWPTDLSGRVVIVGPDKQQPGGHWFAEHGLLCRIDAEPGDDGRIGVRRQRVRTPVNQLRARFPGLFRRALFAEVSPFGVTNLANTNVQPIDGRLFIGYDAGRPVEVDPETLEHVTPVGANDEWLQSAPGLLEPLVSVAAHPAPAHDERALYFVNYSPFPGQQHVSVARWSLSGPIERWPLADMPEIDSIHDIKATEHHLVFSDLPFKVDPDEIRGGERTTPNQDVTNLFIVAKADLRATPPGEEVPMVHVVLPMPTGHLSVDAVEQDGVITAYLEHIPLADLMIQWGADAPEPGYEGLIALGVQPGVIGRHRIRASDGEVLESDLAWDDRFWGGILSTQDESTAAARASRRHLWFAGSGYDPALVPDEWRRLYGDGALEHLVAPADLPDRAVPGALVRYDLESMKVAEVYEFPDGSFASPPTFVPRDEQAFAGDGYVVVLVHRDGDKALQIFDGQDLARGPLAEATAPGFCPPLLLHSCWMPRRRGSRPSAYRVPVARDVLGAVAGIPGIVARIAAVARDQAGR